MNASQPIGQVLRAAGASWALLTVVTGVAYPLGLCAVAGGLWPEAAGGSPVLATLPAASTRGSSAAAPRVVGAAFVGQRFSDPALFWGRPSAAAIPYDAAASSGSNLGPSNPALRERIAAEVARLRASVAGTTSAELPIPADLVTTSASGLDPHISLAAALYQLPRVARARGMAPAALAALIERHREPNPLGLCGPERVHVLRLNLALLQGPPAGS